MQAMDLELKTLTGSIPDRMQKETVPQLVDCGFACRELGAIFQSLKVSFESRQHTISRMLAARVAQKQLMGETPVLRGELASASPDVDVKPKLPKSDSEDHKLLMKHLGVSDELIENDTLRPSWTTLQKIVKDKLAAGEPLPPGIQNTYTDATVVYRRLRKKN